MTARKVLELPRKDFKPVQPVIRLGMPRVAAEVVKGIYRG
jgi:hypothetical protein